MRTVWYSDPVTAICKIHNRNADRLDPLSSTTKLVVGEKNRMNTREFYMYNLRSVMEICRLSTHPGGFAAFETDMELLHVFLCVCLRSHIRTTVLNH